jgi:hypothetical protein
MSSNTQAGRPNERNLHQATGCIVSLAPLLPEHV